MRHASLFYKLFPPPKFLTMPHAGLEISDDALRFIEYKSTTRGLIVSKFGKKDLPMGLMDGGDIKDEKQFMDILKAFVHENKLMYVKVSLPEEKVYLFQTEIPSTDVRAVTQHVEFKLEENVPLAASEAVFYFDVLPSAVAGNTLRASVSVVAKSYVEKILSMLHELGLVPMACEVAPKSIAKAVVPMGTDDTDLVVHMMNRKTGIYVVSGGVVCFSSTVSLGSKFSVLEGGGSIADQLRKEIYRVHTYWTTRPDTFSTIAKVILVGEGVNNIEESLRAHTSDGLPPVVVANTWTNAFDINKYLPPISREVSLEYAVAAGLALPQ